MSDVAAISLRLNYLTYDMMSPANAYRTMTQSVMMYVNYIICPSHLFSRSARRQFLDIRML